MLANTCVSVLFGQSATGLLFLIDWIGSQPCFVGFTCHANGTVKLHRHLHAHFEHTATQVYAWTFMWYALLTIIECSSH